MIVDFDPILFDLGPLQIRWYGLMYVVGFLIGTFLLKRVSDEKLFKVPKERIDSLVTYLIIGMFLGARFFYVFVYNWHEYSNDFLSIFAIWKGGLSFHGAIIGMAIACLLFGKRNKVHPLHIADVSVTVGAQGLFFGRIGNFINGELYGRATDLPWAMIFPAGGPFPRHPSQLYESFFEGAVLFAVLWFTRKGLARPGVQTAKFLIGYGTFRFFIEFFREADKQLGYYFGNLLTMGQILCLIMVLAGAATWYYCAKKKLSITQ